MPLIYALILSLAGFIGGLFPHDANAETDRVSENSSAPTELPAIDVPRSERRDLRLPQQFSTDEARRNAPLQLNMSDGETVKMQEVPKQEEAQSAIDHLIENGEKVIEKRLRVGDLEGATKFREFIRTERRKKGEQMLDRALMAVHFGDSDDPAPVSPDT